MLQKALVIDNNAVILKLLSHILENKDLQVRSASDGLEALEILNDYHPDIIFTDLIMPGIGGENLCRILSGKKTFASTLLIVVSAIVIEEDLDFLGFGAHACIAKGPAATMEANIDLILSLANEGRFDLIRGMRLGTEYLHQRSIAQELLEARHHLQLLFDNLDSGILEFSASERIVSCNAAASRLLGRDTPEVLAATIHDLFTGAESASVREALDTFFSTRTAMESQAPVSLGDKDIIFKLIPMSTNGRDMAIMILRDVSEETKARRELENNLERLEHTVADRTAELQDVNRELERRIAERETINEELEFVARQWSNTFDTITDFISVHDDNMKLVRANRALARHLGEEPEALLGRPCYEVLHGQQEPWPDCPHVKAIEKGSSVTCEIDDPAIGLPLLVTCSPLLHDDGSILGTVHIARDISTQRAAAEEREQLIRKLEDTLEKVKVLKGFIPICSGCKKVRDDKGYWQQVEEYIRDHSEAEFSHSLCPDCSRRLYPEFENDSDL